MSEVRAYADVEAAIRDSVPDATDAVEEYQQLRIRVPRDRRPDALDILKGLGFTHYMFCSGVDWPAQDRFELLDHVYSIEQRRRVTLKCDAPRDDPRVPTATGVYAGANWHERETWELFGIFFAGHPRLARLLLPDWFEGHPMRKDYILPARIEKPWPGESFKPE